MTKQEKWKKMSIVERLRAEQGTWVDTKYDIVHPKRTMLEAAERIEADAKVIEAAQEIARVLCEPVGTHKDVE